MVEQEPPRTRLAQLLRQHHVTLEFRKNYQRAAGGTVLSERQAYRWVAGELSGLPYPAAQATLEEMFGEPVARLFGPPYGIQALRPVRCRNGVAGRGSARTDWEGQVIAMSADRARDFLSRIEASNVGAETLDQLADDVRRLVIAKQWWPQSLAAGAAGIAMLHIERARADLSSWDAAHAWLKVVTGNEIQAGAPGGLFEGGPAIAFAVNAAADVPGKYARAIASLDGYVTLLTRRRLRAAHRRMADGELAAFTEYDVIYGLAGIGSYLLRREQLHDLLRDVLSYLVALTRPLRFGGQTVPGWWTRAAPTGQPSPDFRGGHGNFGMAHGIAGPLALLALTMRHGVGVAGQAEAIGVICAWLDEWRQEATNGPWWPEWITDADVRDHQVHRAGPHRPSWCYGTPGLARAQQLAGQAIGDVGRQHLAQRALAQCLADEALLAQITDRTICHGTAGVFQTAWRAAEDATTPAIAARLPRLRTLLSGTSSGGGDTESTAEGDLIDTAGNLGLLNGAAGIGLALHTATTDAPPSSRWDTCLLIA